MRCRSTWRPSSGAPSSPAPARSSTPRSSARASPSPSSGSVGSGSPQSWRPPSRARTPSSPSTPCRPRLDAARAVGATHGVLAGDDVVDEIRDLTRGGVTVAIEAAGHPGALATAYAATRSGGRIVVAGLPHPRHQIQVPIASLVGEEKSILGSYMGSSVPRRDLPRLFDLYAAGVLPADALVTSRSVPLDDVNGALDRLHAGTEVRQILTP